MILFFGNRPGKPAVDKLTGVQCPSCERYNSLTATITPYFFHLFWIPIFKLNSWYIVQCDHCKAAYFKEEFTSEMKEKLEL